MKAAPPRRTTLPSKRLRLADLNQDGGSVAGCDVTGPKVAPLPGPRKVLSQNRPGPGPGWLGIDRA